MNDSQETGQASQQISQQNKAWYERSAEIEGDSEVGAGFLPDPFARPPFTIEGNGPVRDRSGAAVLTCNDDLPPCALFTDTAVDSNTQFMCPHCGRIGLRMDFASEEQCGIERKGGAE